MMLYFMFLFVAWPLLRALIGEASNLVVVAAWLIGGFLLQRKVRCPECGTSPLTFGRPRLWAKLWPNKLGAECGTDLTIR
jgi:hypothetical protein